MKEWKIHSLINTREIYFESLYFCDFYWFKMCTRLLIPCVSIILVAVWIYLQDIPTGKTDRWNIRTMDTSSSEQLNLQNEKSVQNEIFFSMLHLKTIWGSLL